MSNRLAVNLMMIFILMLNTPSVLSQEAGYSIETLTQGNTLSCLLTPSAEAEVGTTVGGVLEKVNVDRGDLVKPGQLLAKLNTGVERAVVAYRSAKAKYSARKVDRTEELQQKELMSAQELDEIMTEQRLSELELRQGREELKLREIRSPMHGIVVERFRNPGDLVTPEKIFRIVEISPLYVEAVFPVSQFGKIKPGQEMKVSQGLLKKEIMAKVKAVDPVVDPASSTFRVRLVLPNKNREIPSGLRCSLIK